MRTVDGKDGRNLESFVLERQMKTYVLQQQTYIVHQQVLADHHMHGMIGCWALQAEVAAPS